MFITPVLIRAYQRSFDAYPDRTLAITGGILHALGDYMAQLYQILASLSSHIRRLRLTVNAEGA